MDGLRQYILSVIAAALISGIVIRLVNPKTQHGAIVKVLSGLFMVVTVISPLAKLRLSNISAYINDLEMASQSVTENGENMAYDSMCGIIKEQTESYILEKASSLRLQISVDVKLSNDTVPVPAEIVLTGDASPYAKAQLKVYIANEFGLSEECVIWK